MKVSRKCPDDCLTLCDFAKEFCQSCKIHEIAVIIRCQFQLTLWSDWRTGCEAGSIPPTAPVQKKFQILVNGVRPLAINKRTLVLNFGGSTKVVDRLLHAARYQPQLGWLQIARLGSPGVECLIDTSSAERAYVRYLHGEESTPAWSTPLQCPGTQSCRSASTAACIRSSAPADTSKRSNSWRCRSWNSSSRG